VYESLVSYNGSDPFHVTPWLASSYTISSDGKTANFTLRPNIKFADGEPLNSTSVYFSFNRLLILDGSWSSNHGTQASWILQQLENKSLSTYFGGTQPYTTTWVQEVLNQNFVQITGPLTFTLHIQNPNAALVFLLANNAWPTIIAPNYTMTQDLALWKSNGYTLPNPTLTGNLTNQITQYFDDEVSTCNTGATPHGCAVTYLDNSVSGSMAGTGPYTIASVNPQTNEIKLSANSNYWGGGYSTAIHPQIPNIDIQYVPDPTTRELALQNAAKSGQAMAIDVVQDHLYDVANRNAWLQNNTLVSTIPGVSLYGPVSGLDVFFDPFDTNVTNAQTGTYQTFQPFADLRIREAFADAVNITDVNTHINNKLGTVATNVVAPGLNPLGVYNSSIQPAYSFNPDAAARLLIQAMQNPITSFTFENGSVATGVFDNSFGCTTFNSGGTCTSPIATPTIGLYYGAADTVDGQQLTQIASVINNISTTYNMGLTVAPIPVPTGVLLSNAFSHTNPYYMYNLGWFADYNWVVDFTFAMYAPTGTYGGPDGWNISALGNLNAQAFAATSSDNISGVIQITQLENEIANKMIMYLWTWYGLNFLVMTSNVQGFSYNPALSTNAGGDALQTFSTLY